MLTQNYVMLDDSLAARQVRFATSFPDACSTSMAHRRCVKAWTSTSAFAPVAVTRSTDAACSRAVEA
jgi:hypothetical protein